METIFFTISSYALTALVFLIIGIKLGAALYKERLQEKMREEWWNYL